MHVLPVGKTSEAGSRQDFHWNIFIHGVYYWHMKLLRHPLALFVCGCVLGLAGGWVASSTISARAAAADSTDSMTRQGGYQYINPLLSCDISEDTPSPSLGALQQKLQSETTSLIKSGEAKRVSVYIRLMDSGKWTGVNQNDRFAPASLMKVPILITYLKDFQTNANVLTTTYTLSTTPDANDNEIIKPTARLAAGSYTVQELLEAMITQSDNNALQVLQNHASAATLNDVFNNFGVPPALDENSDSVSPQDYMRFFRILYNATYLGRARSQDALEMLSSTTFTQGIVAGVPPGMPVSHKFGERSVVSKNASTGAVVSTTHELHDCGIVYYPHTPYGICIMTQGDDFKTLEHVIADISRVTYQAIDAGALRQ